MDIIKEYKEGRRDFSEADLSGANLSRTYLRWVNLREADLSGANLSGANLHGANLHGANLREANLRGANLSGANLLRVNLLRADLRWADLRWADLRGTNLILANLDGANLIGAKGLLEIQFVENLDRRILEAIKSHPTGNGLDMKNVHHPCGTAHCRAGWALTIHPDGARLEKEYGWFAAAILVYNKCYPKLTIPDFSSDAACHEVMADIEKRAVMGTGEVLDGI